MSRITIRPSAFRQFGPPDETTFCLVTNRLCRDRIELATDANYGQRLLIVEFDDGDDFAALLRSRIPERAHILVVSPHAFFESPATGSLGTGRKLLALACNSTPTTEADLAYFLEIVAATDPQDQEDRAARFFAAAERAQWLELRDPGRGTAARFDHLSDDYIWNQQAGLLLAGEQQLAPSGEISVLPKPITTFDKDVRLAISGSLTLHGVPILHGGRRPYERRQQAEIWAALDSLRHGALRVEVLNGLIESIRPLDDVAVPACRALEAMFAEDPHYRILWEIGFAVHTGHSLRPGNHAMNETFGGSNGTIHLGLGLTPHTTFHLDLICPGTEVVDHAGNPIHGGSRRTDTRLRAVRNQSANCPCGE